MRSLAAFGGGVVGGEVLLTWDLRGPGALVTPRVGLGWTLVAEKISKSSQITARESA